MKSNLTLIDDLNNRILVIDGGMGTNIQNYMLDEKDYRGEILKDFSFNQKGNNDVLSITNPNIIKSIHRGFLEAGADIIETNTLNSNKISQEKFHLEELIYKLNYESAKIARELCDEFKLKDGKKRYVAGSVGPTDKMASLSHNMKDSNLRSINFNELKEAYKEQINALIDGGIDILLIETIYDLLNAKAAVIAANEVYNEKNKSLPIMISCTISDKSGRILSGEYILDFANSIRNNNIISIGLNCSFGAKELITFIKELSDSQELFISVYPNAGVPNEPGFYEESPRILASYIEDMLRKGYVNIVGGCCGTTFSHIKEISKVANKYKPRKIKNML